MKLGFGLPHQGPAASPEALIQVAKRAEELGYDSLWVSDRVLYPVEPQTPYAGMEGMPWPESAQYILNPLHALTFAAAHTSSIALGTSVLVMTYHNPVLLAQSLTTLDILSGGRLRVGLGLGWSEDEAEATGTSLQDRGARADEFIQVLKTIWTTDPVQFQGNFFQVPKSIIGAKPVQQPHPPIYIGGMSPAAMKRTATMADGWNPVGFMPPDQMVQMIAQLKEMARDAGRDAADVKIVVRANLNLTDQPLGKQRWPFNGSLDEVKIDIEAWEHIDIDELFLSPDSTSVEGFLSSMEQLKS